MQRTGRSMTLAHGLGGPPGEEQQDPAVLASPAGYEEAAMNDGSAASVAYWIVPLILGALTLIALAMVARGVRKEDRRYSLRSAAPGSVAQATRWLTRVGASGVPVQPRGRMS
jgi:hypothetical protein